MTAERHSRTRASSQGIVRICFPRIQNLLQFSIMESGLNPFSPNAGSRPPELVGRDDVLTDAQTMIARLPRRLSVQSMFLTGIRGVGKTVLLNEVSRIAEAGKVVYPIYLEATEDRTLAEMLASPLNRSLVEGEFDSSHSRSIGGGERAH